jgi:hypothetical protein
MTSAPFGLAISDLWLRSDPLRILGVAARPDGLIDGEHVAVELLAGLLSRPGAVDPTGIMGELRDADPQAFSMVSTIIDGLEAAKTPDPKAEDKYPSEELSRLAEPVVEGDLLPAL